MYRLSYRLESEALYIHLPQWQPCQLCGIIICGNLLPVIDMAEEEEVERVNVHARVMVYVGYREKIFDAVWLDVKARLFPDFAYQTLLSGLCIVHESARQVQCTLGRVLGATRNQQFPLTV